MMISPNKYDTIITAYKDSILREKKHIKIELMFNFGKRALYLSH